MGRQLLGYGPFLRRRPERRGDRDVLFPVSRGPEKGLSGDQIRGLEPKRHDPGSGDFFETDANRSCGLVFRARHPGYRRSQRYPEMGRKDQGFGEDPVLRFQHPQQHGGMPLGGARAGMDRRDHDDLQFSPDENGCHAACRGCLCPGGNRSHRHEDPGGRTGENRIPIGVGSRRALFEKRLYRRPGQTQGGVGRSADLQYLFPDADAEPLDGQCAGGDKREPVVFR